MNLQRIRFNVGDAGFEPGASKFEPATSIRTRDLKILTWDLDSNPDLKIRIRNLDSNL